MPAYRVRALALKKTKLGETDLIVTFLAEDGSQIRAVAKGARKPGSRFAGRVEPFVVVDLLLHSGRTLETVTDAQIVSAHAGVRGDYDRVVAASVVAGFLEKVSVERQADERLFGLASATLDAMESPEAEALPAVVTAFLVKGMAMQGYRPQFGICASCGAPTRRSRVFSLEAAGPLCERCTQSVRGTMAASPEAQDALEAFMRSRMSELERLQVPAGVVAEAFALIRQLVRYHVPARIKALDVYASLQGADRLK